MPDEPDSGIVTIREIADKAGCSPASVSRALRGKKKVGDALRARIVQAAKEMGYKPNPMIASLMTARTKKLSSNELTANIGWLNTHFEKDFWQKYGYNQTYIKAAKLRAESLGYGFEEVWAAEEGMSGKRLSDIAYARGIQGFIIPGPFFGSFTNDFNLERFAFTCLQDHQRGQSEWNRVCISRRKNVVQAFKSLRRLGYQRIGCVIAVSEEKDAFLDKMHAYNEGRCRTLDFSKQELIGAILSGYNYIKEFVDEQDQLRLFFYERISESFRQPLAEYLDRVRPDAVICNDQAVIEAAQMVGLKTPDDLAVAHLELNNEVEGWSGIYTYPERQSAAAVDQLTAQIERNERGLPPYPKRISIEGKWVDGWTAPNRA